MSYGKVHDVFWDDEKIEALSDRATLLALFLITGPHRNAIGCFRLGLGAITDNPRFKSWGIEGVSDALSELVRMGFIVRDERTGWTFITNALKHDPIKGRKAAIHAAKLAQAVPTNSPVYQALKAKLEPQLEAELKGDTNTPGWPMRSPSMPDRNTIEAPSNPNGRGIETPSIPNRSPEPYPEPYPEPEPYPDPEPESWQTAARGQRTRQRERPGEQDPASVVVRSFMAIRDELWPGSPHLPSPTATLRAQAEGYLKAGATPELCEQVFRRVAEQKRAKGEGPPTNLGFCRLTLENAIRAASVEIAPDEPIDPERKRAEDAYCRALERWARLSADERERQPKPKPSDFGLPEVAKEAAA